jgi:phage replication-related protein YjqB (UPF0714/DUF867 family)
VFGALIARHDVVEVCELRGRFGFLAFHGGALERVTDVVACEAAARTGASYYGVLHPEGAPHVPSYLVDPAQSPLLAAFLEHVEVVIAVHGYGRDDRRDHVLLGGRNRPLATHVARHLAGTLPEYRHIDRIDAMPRELRGMHPHNPVNRPRLAGVQIELPPLLRWHRPAHAWSDTPGAGRAPQVDRLIDGLVGATRSWR